MNHIPNSEIKDDIRITQEEINDFNRELDILMKNPPDNKVRIYLLEGRISERESFICKLNNLLKNRKKEKE